MCRRVRLLVTYELLGSKPLERTLCFISKHLGVDAIILLGNTVSPLAVYRLRGECGIRILGVLGELDNPAVTQALKNTGGLLECRLIEVNSIRLFGLGTSTCKTVGVDGVNILVTSRPGARTTCCEVGSDTVDEVCNTFRPRVVLIGGCMQPCARDGVFSPGSLRLGFFGLLEVGSRDYVFSPYQLDKYLVELARGVGTTV